MFNISIFDNLFYRLCGEKDEYAVYFDLPLHLRGNTAFTNQITR